MTTLWQGNVLGRDDPLFLDGSVVDPDAPAGIIGGSYLGGTVLIEGNVIPDADMDAILAGEPVTQGTYVLGGTVYTPEAP